MEKTKYLDINGSPIYIGSLVYYAKKHSYHANGQLIKGRVTKVVKTGLRIDDKWTSTYPEGQIAVIQVNQ